MEGVDVGISSGVASVSIFSPAPLARRATESGAGIADSAFSASSDVPIDSASSHPHGVQHGGDIVPMQALHSSSLGPMLQHNAEFVASKEYEKYQPKLTVGRRRSIIVTCMDSRLIELLPKACNIRTGEAKVIKTAGAIITHPFGGIMRSVLIAIYELRAEEIFVIGHHDCGMNNINPTGTLEKMVTQGGIPLQTLHTLEYAGINVKRWLHGFDSVTESVSNSVAIIRNHPLMPAFLPVHGLIIDPRTGKLDLLIDGNLSLERRLPTVASEDSLGRAADASDATSRHSASTPADHLSNAEAVTVTAARPAQPITAPSARRESGDMWAFYSTS